MVKKINFAKTFSLSILFAITTFFVDLKSKEDFFDAEAAGEVVIIENSINKLLNKILSEEFDSNSELADKDLSSIKLKDFAKTAVEVCDDLEAQISTWEKIRNKPTFEKEVLEKLRKIRLNLLLLDEDFVLGKDDWEDLVSLIKLLKGVKENRVENKNEKLLLIEKTLKATLWTPTKYLIISPIKYIFSRTMFGLDAAVKDGFKKFMSKVVYYTFFIALIGAIKGGAFDDSSDWKKGILWSFSSLFNFLKEALANKTVVVDDEGIYSLDPEKASFAKRMGLLTVRDLIKDYILGNKWLSSDKVFPKGPNGKEFFLGSGKIDGLLVLLILILFR